MRVLFMGTPDFAVPALLALVGDGHELVGVVTQPDRPRGRGKRVMPSSVKQAAVELGLTVHQPESVGEPDFLRLVRSLAPDVAVVAAFGQKIPSELLNMPRHGFINIHASLLPKYRGAAPIQRCIMDGQCLTGVTIMYMAEGFDTGDIGIQRQVAIHPEMKGYELEAKLAAVGAELIVHFLRLIEEGRAPRMAQERSCATYARKIKDEECVIDWTRPAAEIANKVRALSPDPGVRTYLGGEVLKVHKATAVAGQGHPGQISVGREVLVFCGDGAVRLDEVQPPGGKRMSGGEWARGRRIASGKVFDSISSSMRKGDSQCLSSSTTVL